MNWERRQLCDQLDSSRFLARCAELGFASSSNCSIICAPCSNYAFKKYHDFILVVCAALCIFAVYQHCYATHRTKIQIYFISANILRPFSDDCLDLRIRDAPPYSVKFCRYSSRGEDNPVSRRVAIVLIASDDRPYVSRELLHHG